MGHNGGPDWRAMLAGDDAKMLERVSKYKTPTDVAKALVEAQTKLSQRAELPKIGPTSTPEQVAEYRRAMGLGEIPVDAQPDALMTAFGVKAPDGYTMTEVEKGALGELAKLANSKHMPPSVVQDVASLFFQQQAANAQAINQIDVQRQREWKSQLEQKLGKDFEPMLASIESYVNQMFDNDDATKAEFLNARLPGGGRIGDHPKMFEVLSELALKAGFTDRIEATSMESGGKSLEAQQMEIEALRMTNRSLYDDPKMQQKLDKIIGLRLARGEIDENGNTVRKRRIA